MTKPEFDIRLVDVRDIYEPGDVLICEYSIQVPDDVEVTAVESSVIWFTDGKGEEDLGVHFFERRKKSSLLARQLAEPHRLSTVLPKSPLSYEGEIVQVRWSVRLRVFIAGDKQFTEDLAFQLGATSLVQGADSTEQEEPEE